MRRRIQFSLRGLIGFVAIVCVLLGGWHLLDTYGTHVDAGVTRIGAPIRINGTYFCPFGPRDCGLVVGYARDDDDGSIEKYLRARRSWLCFYSVEYEFEPVDRACQIIVFLRRYEKSKSYMLKNKIIDVN